MRRGISLLFAASTSAMRMPLHYECGAVSSTQELARMKLRDERPPFGVYAGSQTNGRGTSSRSWESPAGRNLYLTVALPLSPLLSAGFPLTLIPLKTGNIIYSVIDPLVSTRPTLKWPNDVLIGGRKVAGVLIESDGECLLVGVGVNVGESPEVEGPRMAGCLSEFCKPGATVSVKEVAEAVVKGFSDFADDPSKEGVVDLFSENVEFGVPVTMRPDSDYPGETAIPSRINEDGSMVVSIGGKELTLVSDYMV